MIRDEKSKSRCYLSGIKMWSSWAKKYSMNNDRYIVTKKEEELKKGGRLGKKCANNEKELNSFVEALCSIIMIVKAFKQN